MIVVFCHNYLNLQPGMVSSDLHLYLYLSHTFNRWRWGYMSECLWVYQQCHYSFAVVDEYQYNIRLSLSLSACLDRLSQVQLQHSDAMA